MPMPPRKPRVDGRGDQGGQEVGGRSLGMRQMTESISHLPTPRNTSLPRLLTHPTNRSLAQPIQTRTPATRAPAHRAHVRIPGRRAPTTLAHKPRQRGHPNDPHSPSPNAALTAPRRMPQNTPHCVWHHRGHALYSPAQHTAALHTRQPASLAQYCRPTPRRGARRARSRVCSRARAAPPRMC